MLSKPEFLLIISKKNFSQP